MLNSIVYGQANIKDVNACSCIYFNQMNKNDNFMNFGLYDTSILKFLNNPNDIRKDGIEFFSVSRGKKLSLNSVIENYHLYDLPDLDWYNLLGLRKIVDESKISDSTQLLENIVATVPEVISKYNFNIIQLLDRRPSFYSPNRIPAKRGIFIKCQRVNAEWYIAQYPSLNSKLIDLKLNLDTLNPEYIKQQSGIIRISYKDTSSIAYPIKLR